MKVIGRILGLLPAAALTAAAVMLPAPAEAPATSMGAARFPRAALRAFCGTLLLGAIAGKALRASPCVAPL